MLRFASTFVAALLVILGVAACEILTPIEEFDYDGLVFDATADVVGDSVRYTLLVRNTSGEEMTVESSCNEEKSGDMTALRIYEPAVDGGRLRWDSSISVATGEGCQLSIHGATIPAGQEIPLTDRVETYRIMGDSIPPGTYRFSVMPNFDGLFREREVSVGVFTLEG